MHARPHSATGDGGGLYGWQNGIVRSCRFMGNRANRGGGVYIRGTILQNCVLAGNYADSVAGGAYIYFATMDNCTVAGNTTTNSGGGVYVYSSTLSNCIVQGNTALTNANADWYNGDLVNGCIYPIPEWAVAVASITNDPQFVDADAGDYRLAGSSPCVNAGTNEPWMASGKDLAGVPRLLFDLVDMGAFEYTGPWIGADALLFPSLGAMVEQGVTNVRWKIDRVLDYEDGTNIVIRTIDVLDMATLAFQVAVASNVPNVTDSVAWVVDTELGFTTSHVIRFEVMDSASNTWTRVFHTNTFTVVPEPAALMVVCACMAWGLQRRRTTARGGR